MGTKKERIEFYADEDVADWLRLQPRMKRSQVLNDAVRNMIKSSDTDELKDLLRRTIERLGGAERVKRKR